MMKFQYNSDKMKSELFDNSVCITFPKCGKPVWYIISPNQMDSNSGTHLNIKVHSYQYKNLHYQDELMYVIFLQWKFP